MTASPPAGATTSLKPYLFRFTWAYALCAVVLAVIASFLPFDIGSGAGIATLFAAAGASGQKFAQDQSRLPDKSERLRFALWASLLTWLVTLLLLAAIVFANIGLGGAPNFLAYTLGYAIDFIRNNLGLAIAVTLVATIVQVALIYYIWNSFARMILKHAKPR